LRKTVSKSNLAPKPLRADLELMESGHDYFYSRSVRQYDEALKINSGKIISDLSKRYRPVRILDVGCGAGYYPFHLETDFAGSVIGYGISATGFPHELRNYHVGDAKKMPYEDNFFHHIVGLDVLEFDEHPEKILKEVIRVLAPGCSAHLSLARGRGDRFWTEHKQELRDMAPIYYNDGIIRIHKLEKTQHL